MATDNRDYRRPQFSERRFQNEELTKPEFEKKFSANWITSGIDESFLGFAEEFGKYLGSVAKQKMTPSQIRNVYGETKRIQMKGFESNKTSFLLLKPKIAYATKRNDGDGIKEFKKVFDKMHASVKTESDYENFMSVFEALIAYHKAFSTTKD